jgi:L-ascorbate metabolism protein UlaG (beta-lactamase superfamily)
MRKSDLTLVLALGMWAMALPAGAAEEPEACPGLVASAPARIVRAAATAQGEVGVTFVGHATFLIETPRGVRIATDYSDGTRPPVAPHVATMNKAHSTHYTSRPDPAIKHVLRGWNPAGGPAYHDVTVEDVRIRNVSTNIRSYDGATEYDGNSIFVFETTKLCIAHLGHLHHELTPDHLRKLGRIDLLFVPVDGGYTLDRFDLLAVLRAINAPLMIPMHFFGRANLDRFLAAVGADFPVEFSRTASIRVSRESLPSRPKVLVLPGH